MKAESNATVERDSFGNYKGDHEERAVRKFLVWLGSNNCKRRLGSRYCVASPSSKSRRVLVEQGVEHILSEYFHLYLEDKVIPSDPRKGPQPVDPELRRPTGRQLI